MTMLDEIAERHRRAGFPGYGGNPLNVEWDALVNFAATIEDSPLNRMGALTALFLIGRPERAAALLAYALEREVEIL